MSQKVTKGIRSNFACNPCLTKHVIKGFLNFGGAEYVISFYIRRGRGSFREPHGREEGNVMMEIEIALM